jgi:hypothetical protein
MTDTNDNQAPKPGKYTTEFWLTVATAVATLAGVIGGLVPGDWGAAILALEAGIYSVVRTWAKLKGQTNATVRKEIMDVLGSPVYLSGFDGGVRRHPPEGGDAGNPTGVGDPGRSPG